MEKEIEIKIINDYQNGISSTTLSKKYNLPKKHILKILNEKKLIRKKDRCKKLNYTFDDNFYYVERICPTCDNIVITKSKTKIIACRNHYNKINKKTSCKNCLTLLNCGSNNPFFGKKHTKETISKISKSRKGKATGVNNPMSKEEYRKKASDNLKLKWKSGDLENVRKFMSDKMKETIRLGKIKSTNSSKKEKDILEFIKNLGFNVIHLYKVDTKICDFYIPKLNLIIEYFGDYWHCNPKKYSDNYFNHKKNKFAHQIWDYDRNKLELVKSYGYIYEVIWENNLKKDNKEIITIINKHDKQNKYAPEWSRKDKDSCSPI